MRFEQRQARRKQIERAEVSVEVIDGRKWTVKKLDDSFDPRRGAEGRGASDPA